MLIDFSVKNYTSFKKPTTLSAETGNRLRKFKDTNTFSNKAVALLKSLLLFGPNGSGKSQLINALTTMRNMVIHSTKTVTDDLPYRPFLFDEHSKDSDTTFEVKLELKKRIYEYSFSYNKRNITKENLFLIRDKERKNIFSRKYNKVSVTNKILKSSIPKLRRNELFLYLAQSENDNDSSKVYKWFAQDLIIIDKNHSLNIPNEYLTLMENEYLKKEMISFLNFADFNIADIEVRDIPNPMYNQLQKIAPDLNLDIPKTLKELFTIHKVYDNNKVINTGKLSLSGESVGTQKLFSIVLSMMLAQTNGNEKTIIIDEFDDSLHAELASALVEVFNSKENRNQFIITTHDIQLLDCDLRIDQIYLLDKDFHGISCLKSVFDFEDARNKGRHDISFAKRYLQGKFGAVPVIDVDGLVDVLKMIHNKYGDMNGKNSTEEA